MDPHRWETIQAAFDELVALDETSRASRLAALATTDPELRAAVESLLAADAEASARLAPLEAGLLSEAGTAPDPLELAGRTISHFQVLEPLGAGGMGVVYRAQDTRLGRAVALKFLLPVYSLDAAAKARFLREGHSAAALDHPNLCAIHEVGESSDGRLFLAMALYEGETLKARLARDGPLPLAHALDISRQIAQGLACAHAAGVVHRDLKPGNVMLLPDGTVKILDFGLAKARDQSASESGTRLGTVSYMAPEQIRGEAVDGRTDLWALGVVLYEMLTARKAFGGEHQVTIGHAILHDEPVPPSKLRAEVSAAVEHIVLRLLHPDPATRYQAADELLADLGRIGTIEETAIRSARQRRGPVRHVLTGKGRRVMAVGAALVVGAFGYTAITRTGDDGGDVAERTAIAVLPFQNLSAEGPHAYFASGLHDEILSQLSKVAALKVINRASVSAYGGPDRPPLRQIARELGVGTVVEASVQVVGNSLRVNVQATDVASGTYVWSERYDRALDDAFAVQSDIAQQIASAVGGALTGEERAKLAAAPTTNAQAYLFYLQGQEYDNRPGELREDYELAEQLYEQALALDPEFALARAALSQVHGIMYWYRYDPSPVRAARARQEAEAALRLAPNLPQAHLAMGRVYYHGRDWQRAMGEYQQALNGLPNDVQILSWIGAVHRRLGRWDEVLATVERIVELDPRDIPTLWDLGGQTYRSLHRHGEEVRLLDRALSLVPDLHIAKIERGWAFVRWRGELDTLRQVLGNLPNTVITAYGPVASHRIELALLERDVDTLMDLLDDPQAFVDRGADYLYAPGFLYVGWGHQLRGRHDAAQAAFLNARELLDSVVGELPDDWRVHAALGLAEAGLGRRVEARSEAEWLLTSDTYRRDAFDGPLLAEARARILVQLGDAEGALDEIERLLAGPSWVSVHTLRLDPRWDPIRDHPRFKALLARYQHAS